MQTNQYLKQLLLGHIKGTISETERQTLFTSLADDGLAEEWKLVIKELSSEVQISKPYNDEEWESMIQGILKPENKVAPVHRIHLLRKAWFRYAAAAVLIIGIGTAVVVSLTNNKKSDQTLANGNKQLPNDVLPGSERAILTLANGQTIVLDSMQGNIVQQGGLTVSNENGKLDYEGKAGNVEYHSMSTPRGGQYKLQLPDGTDVWLNAASSITYPTAFLGKERNVSITGEAYFEVAKDKTKPFRVNIDNKSEVEVLGTHFNINSYTDEGIIKTTLLEGSVRVIKGNDMAMLKPGQQAQLAVVTSSDRQQPNTTGITVVNNTDLEQVIAWKNGSFQFNKTSLSAVLRQLSRWYDVDVVYEKGVPDINLGGEMKRDLNLSQVLTGLGKIGVNFRIEGKKLVVLP